MATTIEQLEAQVKELQAQLDNPVSILRRLLAQLEREGPKPANVDEPARAPNAAAARARAEDTLRQVRLRRRSG